MSDPVEQMLEGEDGQLRYDLWLTLSPGDKALAIDALRRAVVGQRRLFSLMQAYEVASHLKLWAEPLRVIADAFKLEAHALKGTFTKPSDDEIVRRAMMGSPAERDEQVDFDRWVMREHLLVCAEAYYRTARWVTEGDGKIDRASRQYHAVLGSVYAQLPPDAQEKIGYVPPPKTYEDVVLLMLALYGENHPLNFGSLKAMTMAEARSVAAKIAKGNDLKIDGLTDE
jgi:hypothetical protein